MTQAVRFGFITALLLISACAKTPYRSVRVQAQQFETPAPSLPPVVKSRTMQQIRLDLGLPVDPNDSISGESISDESNESWETEPDPIDPDSDQFTQAPGPLPDSRPSLTPSPQISQPYQPQAPPPTQIPAPIPGPSRPAQQPPRPGPSLRPQPPAQPPTVRPPVQPPAVRLPAPAPRPVQPPTATPTVSSAPAPRPGQPITPAPTQPDQSVRPIQPPPAAVPIQTPKFDTVRVKLFPIRAGTPDVPANDAYGSNALVRYVTWLANRPILVKTGDGTLLFRATKKVKVDLDQALVEGDDSQKRPFAQIWIEGESSGASPIAAVEGLTPNASDRKERTLQRNYSGRFLIEAGAGVKPKIINFVDLESYVQTVVASEIYMSWADSPLTAEAVKAQAVAVRSYTLNIIAGIRERERPKKGFTPVKSEWDMLPTTSNQAYTKTTGITDKFKQAVSETRSQILVYTGQNELYRNKVILASYSANSGGTTCSNADCYGMPIPYLLSVPDHPGVRGLAGGENPLQLNLTTLVEALKAQGATGVTTQNFINLGVSEVNGSQRVKRLSVLLKGTAPVQLSEASTRLISGRHLLRTGGNFAPGQVIGNVYKYKLLGNGHGVGLSQMGAFAFARDGKRYEEILGHYYRDVTLARP